MMSGENTDIGFPLQQEVRGLLMKLLGPSFDEAGGILGDRIRHWRLKNQIKIMRQTFALLDSEGVKPKTVNMKVLLPLLESATLEDDEEMCNRWSSLLASAADPKNHNELEPSFIEILKQLPPLHALVLDVFYEQIEQKKIAPSEWQEHGIVTQYLRETRERDETVFGVALDNLLRLRLLEHPSGLLDEVNGSEVRFQVTSAGILCATHLGSAFVNACKRRPPDFFRGKYYQVPSNSIDNVFAHRGTFIKPFPYDELRNI